MNCDCLSNLRESLINFHNEKGIMEVYDVKVPTLIKLKPDSMDDVTYTDVRLRTNKGNKILTVNHSFCPFCGTKIEKEDKDGN